MDFVENDVEHADKTCRQQNDRRNVRLHDIETSHQWKPAGCISKFMALRALSLPQAVASGTMQMPVESRDESPSVELPRILSAKRDEMAAKLSKAVALSLMCGFNYGTYALDGMTGVYRRKPTVKFLRHTERARVVARKCVDGHAESHVQRAFPRTRWRRLDTFAADERQFAWVHVGACLTIRYESHWTKWPTTPTSVDGKDDMVAILFKEMMFRLERIHTPLLQSTGKDCKIIGMSPHAPSKDKRHWRGSRATSWKSQGETCHRCFLECPKLGASVSSKATSVHKLTWSSCMAEYTNLAVFLPTNNRRSSSKRGGVQPRGT
ncbi:hypothetical protein Ae201684P_003435 [Aphanomyces euteiches]|nr:hypothetical protein Ae201684P_003435 [Aphanomyces euteiches]